MSTESFLDGIYQGSFDGEVFRTFRTPKPGDKVRILLDSFRQLMEEYPPSQLEEEGRIPDKMLKEMGRIGLFGISIPELYGGLGFDLWEYLKTVEELTSVDLAVSLVSMAHLSIGVKGIVLFGTEEQKEKYLKPAATGEMIFSYALTEPHIGSDAQHIETKAELSPDGTHYILNGHKTYITNANYAGGLTVFAQMDPKRPGFMGAFIVETNREGVKIGKDMPKMGLKVSSTAAIQFKDVRVPVENLLGKPGDGFKIAMTILNYGRLGLGASSVGMMEQSIEDMKARSSSRIQFGVPIKDFPLVQEKMVTARVNSTIASAMNAFAGGLLEDDVLANVALETSHCKLFGTTRAWDTLYDALQVAGGAGYLATQPYEKRMRDFRVATVFEGTTEIHSIYPALFLMRKISKQMELLNAGRFSQLGFLLRNLFSRTRWPLKYKNKVMQKAAKLARANARTIRRMLFVGLLVYGKKAQEKEFFLRRITTLSLYLFGLLALLARLTSDHKAGRLRQEDLHVLHYFLEEAKEARDKNRRLFFSKKEALHDRIFRSLFR